MGQEGGRKISDMTDEDYGLRRGNERRGARFRAQHELALEKSWAARD